MKKIARSLPIPRVISVSCVFSCSCCCSIIRPLLIRLSARFSVCLKDLIQARHQLDRQREDDGGVFLDSNLCQCLQITQLKRHWLSRKHLSCISQSLRSRKFAFGVNDLRSLFAFSLS